MSQAAETLMGKLDAAYRRIVGGTYTVLAWPDLVEWFIVTADAANKGAAARREHQGDMRADAERQDRVAGLHHAVQLFREQADPQPNEVVAAAEVFRLYLEGERDE